MSLAAGSFSAELEQWLDAQLKRYAAEPSEATALLPQALQRFEAGLAQPPGAAQLRLALLIFDLAVELRNIGALTAIATPALACCEAGVAPELLPQLLCMQARVEVFQQRIERAVPLVERALLAAEQRDDALGRAAAVFALGLLAARQLDPRRAAASYADAIKLFKACGHHGPWVQAYAGMSTAYRALDDQPARLAALHEGVQMCMAQRRWSEAANLNTGMIDVALEQGDVAAAEQALAQGQLLADRADPSGLSAAHSIVRHGRACCLAARGQFRAAAEDCRAALAERAFHIAPADLARRCEQMADWLLAAGEPVQALAASRQGQAALEAMASNATQQAQTQLRARLELAHIQAQSERGRAQARELQSRNEALEQALGLQRELQAELVESIKFASLGNLLAGLAHELAAPLQNGLEALTRSLAQGELMLQQIDSGSASRSRLNQTLQRCEQDTATALAALEQALHLLGAYRHLETPPLGGATEAVDLAALVEAVWRRAITPGSALRLELDAALTLTLRSDVLAELLLQLLQNIERHAYPAGQAGVARVQARLHEGRLHLIVSDRGRGVASTLLAQLFDDEARRLDAGTRHAAGLGLSIVRAAVVEHLGGSIRALHNPGGGLRIEASWPI
ncbi:ATP-binding protein [Paucibacter sp. APW11]|uniref:ATP-binding protein n=1 Tax=Roseateles aquae TaxID=3077235 RepID=A0ABU3PBM7_9BURK|nr:ATP-binding protein [Paucibacter sp. APW11]MDT8999970.1 ATP-binding protein [Paucibacter sp. APW11]